MQYICIFWGFTVYVCLKLIHVYPMLNIDGQLSSKKSKFIKPNIKKYIIYFRLIFYLQITQILRSNPKNWYPSLKSGNISPWRSNYQNTDDNIFAFFKIGNRVKGNSIVFIFNSTHKNYSKKIETFHRNLWLFVFQTFIIKMQLVYDWPEVFVVS